MQILEVSRSHESPEYFFRSPELKAQFSYPGRLLSVACLSICCSVNFSHFHLLLQNRQANFNQTWHKSFLSNGNSSLFK